MFFTYLYNIILKEMKGENLIMNDTALRFYTVKKASEMIGVSGNTLRRILEDRDIPTYRFGKQIRISAEAFDAYINSVRIDYSDLNPSC